MIGRERERDVLRGAVARAAKGGSAFVLVVGESGIGKTTLLQVLADLAVDARFAVGYGRGEPDGGGPLWPWRLALTTIGARRHRTATVVPLSDARSGGPVSAFDGGADRFSVFERFAADLSARAIDGPVAVVIDDLQWADVSALRLFRHLVDRPSLPGVLVAAGVRTTEPLAFDVSEAVSGLLAHPSVELVEVPAFGEGEISEFANERLARRPSDQEVAVFAERSGGNPFLLGELLRWVPMDGSGVEPLTSLPLAVRESVRRRLVVEDAVTQQVVKAVAVAGTMPSLDVLAKVIHVDRVEVGSALDCAHRGGLLAMSADGAVSFVHDLVRQAVLSLLPTWARIQLHHAVGTALAADVRSSSWATVATHLSAARPLADDATLADVARRAAFEASRAGAFDESASHLAVVLNLTEPAGDTAERGHLLLQRGRVLWAAERAEESTAVLGEAAALARRTDDAELLARVALSWRGGELRVILRRADEQFLALLREALAACPPDDSQLRCLLLSRWVRCASWDITDRDILAACDEAVAMARRLGDPETLTDALGTLFYYRWRPDLVHERLAIADEVLAVAVATADADLIAQSSYFRLHVLLELGRLRDAWSELDRFETAVGVSGKPLLKVRALWFRATRQLALGERAQAEELVDQACGLAERMGRPDAMVERLGLSLWLWAAEDRVDDVVRILRPSVRHPAAYNSVVALANGFGGRPAEARAALDAVVAAGLERHPRDMTWMFGQCGLLAAAVVSGDRETGQVLYDALSPFAGQWAVLNSGIVVAGAVDHYLGIGAALLGRTGDAVDHLRRAAAAHEREDAVALALCSLHELATVLTRRREPGDDAEIATVEQRIALLAARNTVPFKPLLQVLWSAPDTAPDTAPLSQQPQRLVLEGDTWLIEFAGAGARLRDQRGLHHLRTLLERPGVEIPALTLAGIDQGLAGSIEATILDDRAMRDYRQRISDLHEDIDEATTNHDIERAARTEAELDTLIEHLAAATGVGGRPRQFTGADERARVSVTKAIRSAINHLGDQLPELRRHLTATVHTGSRCVYQPDPRTPGRWETERL